MAINYAVIGLGTFGKAVAISLIEYNKQVIAIDQDEKVINEISDIITHSVVLDATDEKALKSVDIQDVDVAIIGVGDIQDSILITLLLKDMGIKNIIAKAINEQQKRVLAKIGATKIILPEIEVGKNLVRSMVSSKIFDNIEMSEKYSIIEIEPLSKWINKTIKEADIRHKFNLSIVGIKRKYPHIDEKGEMSEIEDIIIAPGADTEIQKKDILIIIGDKEALEKL